MRSAAAVLVLVACHTPFVVPAPTGTSLALPAENVALAPAIVVPVAAEMEYLALDPHDVRLDAACADLAFLVGRGGAATIDIATAVLRMHGIIDPPNKVLAGAVGEDLDAKLGQDALRPNAMIGKGSFEQTAVEILILQPKIRIGPVPRAVTTSVELSVVLDPALHDPHVTVADPYESFQPTVDVAEQVLHFTVPCGFRPSERFITIEATDPSHATQPLVIFPIYCKLTPPASLATEPLKNLVGYADLDGRLTSILNRERVLVGLKPLLRDARVEAAARNYARARIVNRAANGTTVMRDAGLISPAMSWSTFHADSLESAVDRVLNSADELSKLRNPERTDIGVGTVRDRDGWWISIVYVTIPPAIDTTAAATQIAHGIQRVQRSKSIQARIDAYANEVATHYANALAFGWRPVDFEEEAAIETQMRLGMNCEYAIDSRVELANLDIDKLIGKHVFHTIGVGVSQSARNGALAGTIWIVVVFY